MHRTRLVMLSALIVSICLSGCGPGQIFGPTQTLTPTSTPTATATSTPSATPTPRPTATEEDLFPAYGLPGGTISELLLQSDVFRYIVIYAVVDGCERPQVTNTVVVSPLSHGKWSERWTVDECGKKKSYLMKMSAAAGGGTDFEIMPEN